MFQQLSRASRRLAITLGVVALGCVVYACAGGKPWDREITRRLTAGRELKLEHFMTIGFWWASVAGALLGALGAATVRWWGPEPAAAGGPAPVSRLPRLFWIGLALVLAAGAWWRVPRLTHSLWNDEAYAARAYVYGVQEARPDGTLHHKPVSWKTALFLNEKGNNHVWCSLEARASLFLWQKLTGRPADALSEAAMRLPALLSSLATLAALALLGAQLGCWRSGLLAALVLALHPWHLRYSCEVRGYSTMLLASLVMLICLLRALREPKWRWWLGFAAAELVSLLAFAGSVYLPVLLNAGALFLLWRRRDLPRAARLLVASVPAAIVFLWIFAPSIPQLREYLKGYADRGLYQMSAGWFADLWSCLACGFPWSTPDIAAQPGVSLSLLASHSLLASIFFLGLLPVVLLLHLVRRVRISAESALVTLALLGATALGLVHNQFSRAPVVVWYFLPAVLWFALGLGHIWRAGVARWVVLASLVPAALFIFLTAPPRDAMAHRDRQPMRQVVASLRSHFPGARTGVFSVSDRQIVLYDPSVTVLKTPADLDALEQRAAAEKKPLIIYYAGHEEAAKRTPELLRRVEEGWRESQFVPGLEEMFSYHIMQKKPAAAPVRPAP